MDELELPEHQVAELWVKIELYSMARSETAAAYERYEDSKDPNVRKAEAKEEKYRVALKKFIRFED